MRFSPETTKKNMKKIAYASSRPIAMGEPKPYNFFFPPGKMCWT